jgi:hypothetical protein
MKGGEVKANPFEVVGFIIYIQRDSEEAINVSA